MSIAQSDEAFCVLCDKDGGAAKAMSDTTGCELECHCQNMPSDVAHLPLLPLALDGSVPTSAADIEAPQPLDISDRVTYPRPNRFYDATPWNALQAARGVFVSALCLPIDCFEVLAELGKAAFRACGEGCSGERREEVLTRVGQLLRLLVDTALLPVYLLRGLGLLLLSLLQVLAAACGSLCTSTSRVWSEVDDLPGALREGATALSNTHPTPAQL